MPENTKNVVIYIQALVTNSDLYGSWKKVCTNKLRRLTYLYHRLLMKETTDYQTSRSSP